MTSFPGSQRAYGEIPGVSLLSKNIPQSEGNRSAVTDGDGVNLRACRAAK